MCRASLLSLLHAGHQPVAVVDATIKDDALAAGLADDRLELVVPCRQSRKRTWKAVYATCDATLIIAPECEGILKSTLKWFSRRKMPTCNADEHFLKNATDKLATARRLRRHEVPHPPTRSLAQANRRWVRRIHEELLAAGGQEPIWVMKRRAGVGCEGMERMTAGKIAQRRRCNKRAFDPREWIVQPWIAGNSYSRAAIFDSAGNPHWLPVTRQHLSVTDSVHYCGGTVEPERIVAMPGLDDVLLRASQALGRGCRGWIGFDFLYDGNAAEPITIIEINPRLTTSFVGLCAAGAPDLAAAIVAARCGQPVQLPSHWQRMHFTASGETRAE